MRYLLPFVALLLVGCGQNQSEASRIGEGKWRIVSPAIAGGAEGPNRRMANQLCPSGFLMLDSAAHKGGPDRVDNDEQNITTIWTIKCI
jgi:hypothetical protein